MLLRAHLPALNKDALASDVHGVMHGFMPGRSPMTNAMPHIGHRYSVCMDLASWFDSVCPEHVPEHWRKPELFPDGRARQGLPTSPGLANLAAAPMVDALMKLRVKGRFGWSFTMTVYCDDISVSCWLKDTVDWVLNTFPPIIASFGFAVNESKTRVQSARAGRRIITGYAVDDYRVYPTRYIKRRLRAARHQGHSSQARGLAEFCQLRLPKAWAKAQKEAKEMAAAASRMPQERSQVSGGINSAPPVVGPYKRKLALE